METKHFSLAVVGSVFEASRACFTRFFERNSCCFYLHLHLTLHSAVMLSFVLYEKQSALYEWKDYRQQKQLVSLFFCFVF